MWKRRTPRKPEGLTVFLGEACEIEGRCRFVGVAMLEGRVRGDLLTADELVVGEGASIVATVHAKVLIVRGTITGDIVAADRVELCETARVVGNIEAPRLTMTEGAVLEGHCRVTHERENAQPGAVVVPLAR